MLLLPKRMVLAYADAAHAMTVDLPPEQAIRTSQEDSNLFCPTPKIATVQFRPTQNREVQMIRHKIVESKDFQLLAQDWKNKVILSQAYAEYRNRIIDMLTKIYFIWDVQLGRSSIAKHRMILLLNSNPTHLALYEAGPIIREFRRLEIEKMLCQIVIKPAQSKLATPIASTAKQRRIPLLCVDYKMLSNLTRRWSYLSQRLDKSIDSLGEATVFSTLPLNSGYWQAEIERKDRDKTAFSSHRGL